jgi:lysozyme
MSFISSLLNIFSSFGLTISPNGFQFTPPTKIRTGAIFNQMLTAINYVDNNGNYFVGQPYGSNSIAAKPQYQQATPYQPGETTPPKSWPTSQPNGYNVPLGVNDVNIYHMSAEGLRHLKAYEGLHQRPYIINGRKFIGYGRKLPVNDTTTYISRDQAEEFLQLDVLLAETQVKSAINVKITQGQFDALVDFAYTVEPEKFQNSDVVKNINNGDIGAACTSLAQWVYGMQDGILAQFPHLVSRRTANIHWMTMPADPQPLS